jgi:hypothetical protein
MEYGAQLYQAIEKLGFPIVVTLLLVYTFGKELKRLREEAQSTRELHLLIAQKLGVDTSLLNLNRGGKS